jgi:GNAT superfamily N-acetyltransferase
MTRIRPMTSGDAEAVADLATQLGYPTSDEHAAARIGRILSRPEEHAAFVAVDAEDRAIGWAHVELVHPLTHDEGANLAGLVVDEAHRSGGIGDALLRAVEVWAAERGARVLVVRSRTTRTRAHRFYETRGYRLDKVSHVYEKPLG